MLFFSAFKIGREKMQLRSTGRHPAPEMILQVMCNKTWHHDICSPVMGCVGEPGGGLIYWGL